MQRCASACGNGILEAQLGEECDDGDSNGKNQKCSSTCRLLEPGKPNCGNGQIDPGETCSNCPKDVQRCASACGNGILETQLGEECDDGDSNGQNQQCSSTCKNVNRCGNGQIDLGESCHTCPEDVPTCDRDGDGIPDVFDQCPDIPEEINGIQDQDGCPEITPPCTGTHCPLVAPLCNSCPCQYADFSNTLHKNDSVRAHLGDQEFKAHYSSSPFSPLKDFLEF
ncbi:MAG: hypothetical protein Q4B28_06105 [bacterium]|nr:hypothetical protein [bacterium]